SCRAAGQPPFTLCKYLPLQVRATLPPVIRARLFPLALCLLPVALGACATPAPSAAVVEAATPAAPAADTSTPAAAEPGDGLLPKVPQPPERPVAPASVTDPAIPRAQRI